MAASEPPSDTEPSAISQSPLTRRRQRRQTKVDGARAHPATVSRNLDCRKTDEGLNALASERGRRCESHFPPRDARRPVAVRVPCQIRQAPCQQPACFASSKISRFVTPAGGACTHLSSSPTG